MKRVLGIGARIGLAVLLKWPPQLFAATGTVEGLISSGSVSGFDGLDELASLGTEVEDALHHQTA